MKKIFSLFVLLFCFTLTADYIDMPGTGGGGGGEANTASNVGTGDGLFKTKSGVDLQFKSILAGAGITVTPGTNEVTIASTATGDVTGAASSVAFGIPVFADTSGKVLSSVTLWRAGDGPGFLYCEAGETCTLGDSDPQYRPQDGWFNGTVSVGTNGSFNESDLNLTNVHLSQNELLLTATGQGKLAASGTSGALGVLQSHQDDDGGPLLFMQKSRGGGTPSDVQQNDALMSLIATGYSGGLFRTGAKMYSIVSDTVVPGQNPASSWIWDTTDSAGVETERLRLTHDGKMVFTGDEVKFTGTANLGTSDPAERPNKVYVGSQVQFGIDDSLGNRAIVATGAGGPNTIDTIADQHRLLDEDGTTEFLTADSTNGLVSSLSMKFSGTRDIGTSTVADRPNDLWMGNRLLFGTGNTSANRTMIKSHTGSPERLRISADLLHLYASDDTEQYAVMGLFNPNEHFLSLTGPTAYLLWGTDAGGDLGSRNNGSTFERPNKAWVKDSVNIGNGTTNGKLKMASTSGANIEWGTSGGGDVGTAGGASPMNIHLAADQSYVGFSEANADNAKIQLDGVLLKNTITSASGDVSWRVYDDTDQIFGITKNSTFGQYTDVIGDLMFPNDGTWDIGQNSAISPGGYVARPRDIYVKRDVKLALGGGLKIEEGSDATSGIATLVTGAVTVTTAAAVATSRIQCTCNDVNGGVQGFLECKPTSGSFNITSSSAADTCKVAWLIINQP